LPIAKIRKKAADITADTEDLDDLAPNGETVAEALNLVEDELDLSTKKGPRRPE
jgi:hypothetical protein